MATDARWWVGAILAIFIFVGLSPLVPWFENAILHRSNGVPDAPEGISEAESDSAGGRITKLTLIFPEGTDPPMQQEAYNIHWASWNGLEEAMPAFHIFSQPNYSIGRETLVQDTVLLFLSFDHPIKYGDFHLAMADGSAVPRWEKYETTDKTAIISIHGKVKANVPLSIEPVAVTEHPVQ